MTREVKAKILLNNTLVEIEGSPEDVSATILSIESAAPTPPQGRRVLKPVLRQLVDEGFFTTPRSMADIKAELYAKQAVYNPTSLFPVLYKEFLKTGAIIHEGKRGSFKYLQAGARK